MFTSLTNRLQRREAGEKGFTLLELIAVVVVIAILAAIAIGMFSNQEKAAHASALAQDVANSRASVLDATKGTGPFEGAPTVASEGNTVVAASHPDIPGGHMIYGWNAESDSEICFDSTTGQTNADTCGAVNPAKNAGSDGGSGGGDEYDDGDDRSNYEICASETWQGQHPYMAGYNGGQNFHYSGISDWEAANGVTIASIWDDGRCRSEFQRGWADGANGTWSPR